jgi:NAD(P)-dependent dehydrogenase (short-subunit alcohol dehydrogenase family)
MPDGDPFALTDRAAIVTGASSGLGWHFALTLARAGAKVAVMARRLDRLTALAGEIEGFDGRAVPIELDVLSPDSVVRAVTAAEEELGPISVLVNNAGTVASAPALDTAVEDWDAVVDTNLRGAWLVAQETARHMVRLGHGGSIVNIVSILGSVVTRGVAAYCASKAGLVHLTKALALELARYDIRVNAIAPGYYQTELTRAWLDSEAGQAMAKSIPQRRLGRPEDLDGALLLLASDASRYMTGTVLTVDGGHSLVNH